MLSATSFKTRKFKIAVLFLLALIACVHFRLYAYHEYPKLMARNTSTLFIYSNIKKVVNQSADQKFAAYPAERQKRLRDLLLTQTLKNENLKIKFMVEEASKGLLPRFQKSMQYLGEVDPYYYLGLTRRVLSTGKFAERKEGRNYFNPMMLAPLGSWYPVDYHPYVGALFYRLLKAVRPSISLVQALSLVPIALSCLCLVPFFFILLKRLNLSLAATLTGAAFFVSCPMFVRRSLYGWFDTDPYNVFFPLVLLYLFLGVLTLKEHSRKNILAYGFGIGLVFAVYSLFWRGWMLFLGVYVLSTTLCVFFAPKNVKAGFWKILGLALISVSVFLILFWGIAGFRETLDDAHTFAIEFLAPKFNVWPDVFISVGELRPLTFLKLSALVIYPFIILLALVGLFKGLLSRFKENSPASAGYALLSILLVLHLCLAIRVERFALLLVMPLSIALAVCFNELFTAIRRFLEFIQIRDLLKKLLYSGSLVAVLYLFLRFIFTFSHESIRVEHPIYNESWDKMMQVIRSESPADSIVTTWWSPGHFITGMAERRVTFDGATQNTPQAYWVARFFLENSEEKAFGILRMLNHSGNEALDYLTDQKIPLADAIDLLDSIFALDRSAAQEKLSHSLKPEQVQTVLNFTHPEKLTSPNYVFLYDDMIRQIMALEFIGNWDFRKAVRFGDYLKVNPDKIPSKMLKRGEADNTRLLWSLSNGPWPEEPEALVARESANTWFFINGVRLEKDFSNVSMQSDKFGKGIPKTLLILNPDGSVKEIPEARGNLNLSVLFFKDEILSAKEKKTIYKTVIADKRLMDSIAFRLYYMNGAGLKHFKPVASEDNELSRNRFYLYRAD